MQREFWKHNINPITGYVFCSRTEQSKQILMEQARLRKTGWKKNYELQAEYVCDIHSIF